MHYIFKNWLFFSIVGILAHLKIEGLKAENGDTLPGLQGTSPVSITLLRCENGGTLPSLQDTSPVFPSHSTVWIICF